MVVYCCWSIIRKKIECDGESGEDMSDTREEEEGLMGFMAGLKLWNPLYSIGMSWSFVPLEFLPDYMLNLKKLWVELIPVCWLISFSFISILMASHMAKFPAILIVFWLIFAGISKKTPPHILELEFKNWLQTWSQILVSISSQFLLVLIWPSFLLLQEFHAFVIFNSSEYFLIKEHVLNQPKGLKNSP